MSVGSSAAQTDLTCPQRVQEWLGLDLQSLHVYTCSGARRDVVPLIGVEWEGLIVNKCTHFEQATYVDRRRASCFFQWSFEELSQHHIEAQPPSYKGTGELKTASTTTNVTRVV